MAQVKDLVVTGPSRCVGPVSISEVAKIGKATIKYDEEAQAIVITYEED
jgi:hypothetical protein